MNINKLNSAMTECVTTDLTLRQEKPEQFKKDLYHRSVVGGAVLFIVLVIINQIVGTPHDRLEKKKGFMEYVSVKMVEYQDDLVQEEWPDLLSSLDAKEWKILEMNSSYDLDVEQAAKQLLGEKLVIRGWRDLQEYQGELLWEAWSKSDQNIAPDQFIEEQIQNHIQKKTLPYLKHNTWLVTDAQGVDYILCERETWGICPMSTVTAVGLLKE